MFLKKILTNACVYYTVIITVFYTFGSLVNNSTLIPNLRMYALLGFSLCFSALNEGLKKIKFSFAIKFLLHLAASGLLYYLSFIVGSGLHKNSGQAIAGMIVFTFVYLIGTVILLVTRRVSAKKTKSQKGAKEEYTSMFKK